MDWLDPLDAAMMNAEVLANPLNIGVVLIVSPPADADPGYVDQLHGQELAGRDPVRPQLRRYPHRGIETGGGWVWREATVDLSEHYKRHTLAPGSGRDELWRLVSRLHAEPLDRSRPMWLSYLIDGLNDGCFAMYIKVHHTVMDGVAGFRMIADGLSPDKTRRSMPAFHVEPRREPNAAEIRRGLRLPHPFPMLRSLVSAGASSFGLVQRVFTGGMSTVVASLTRDTTVPPLAAPYMRFNRRLEHERVVAAGSWPKRRIRALQRTAGVTGNDVVTAVVAGVLRSWLLDRAELPKRSLVAICPITVRGRGNGPPPDRHGNMFGAWLCPLGTDLDAPAERLQLIHRSMSEGKRQIANLGAGVSLLLLAPAIGPTVLSPMLPFVPRVRTGYNLPISHVPGPSSEMYWNGAHIEEIYPVSAVYDGQALNVTTCSYADRVSFGYVAGREVIPDIDTLIPLTEQSLSELEGAIGVRF
ncbi:MAG: wax ester/triacylglycerol synthase family O-acyltransferase [Actinomycetia bacterium]|nr:wax ester/triacylglycerol synthase family O-acyltransferase [Actinomycetes bacterium]